MTASRSNQRRLWPLLAPGRGEAPTSLLSRLARLHGRNPAGLCRDFALSYQGVVEGVASALAAFGRLVGVEPRALEAEALRKVGEQRWEYKGETVTGPMLCRATKRVCPLCLVGDVTGAGGHRHAALHAYGRALWALDPIRTCPDHGVALDVVASSSRPSELHDFAGAVAPLLGDLSALERSARPASPSPMEGYLLGRLRGRRGAGWLDGLAWHAAADVCQTIGAVALHGPTVSTDRYGDEERRAAGGAGHAIAVDGEKGVRSFLERLDRSYEGSRSSTDGPQARYGHLFKRLVATTGEPDLDPLRDVVARHVVETTPVGPGDTLFGKPVERRVVHSIRSASLEHAVHPKRLRKILRAKGVIGVEHDGATDERATFPAADNEDLLRKAASSLSLTDVETYLNAGRVHAKLLMDEGFIEPFVIIPGEKLGERNFVRSDLDDFLARLRCDAVEVAEPPPGAFDVPSAARRANCGAGEILRLVLDRRLDWVGRLIGVEGYVSVLVDVAEVRRNVQGPARSGLTARDLENRLSAGTSVVAALIEHGRLPTSTIVNPVNRCPTRVVSLEDVAAFEAEYVSLHALSIASGRHFIQVKKALESRGVKPALPRETYRATFYRRADTMGL